MLAGPQTQKKRLGTTALSKMCESVESMVCKTQKLEIQIWFCKEKKKIA